MVKLENLFSRVGVGFIQAIPLSPRVAEDRWC